MPVLRFQYAHERASKMPGGAFSRVSPKIVRPDYATERPLIFHSSPGHDVCKERNGVGQSFGGCFEPDNAPGDCEQFWSFRQGFHTVMGSRVTSTASTALLSRARTWSGNVGTSSKYPSALSVINGLNLRP